MPSSTIAYLLDGVPGPLPSRSASLFGVPDRRLIVPPKPFILFLGCGDLNSADSVSLAALDCSQVSEAWSVYVSVKSLFLV